MKKMMMLAVMGLLGTAGAVNTVGGNIVFNANVQEVCLVAGGAFPNSSYTVSTPAFNYVANGGANQGYTTADSGMIIKCTKGTDLTVNTSTTTGDPDSKLANGPTTTLQGNMSLTGGSTPLEGKYTVTVNKGTGTDGADTYGGTVGFKANQNQWGVEAGTYSGTLTVTLSYN